MNNQIETEIYKNVKDALHEDIGNEDITSKLVPASNMASAEVIVRHTAVICGVDWVNEVFKQLNTSIKIKWLVQEGEKVKANTKLFNINGSARDLLTGERTALNFLQLLSGISTKCREYADMVKHTNVKLLDTRKTIPGLRLAQKYATKVGGCKNHRIGLFDAFLIKENHINACGSIKNAVSTAKKQDTSKSIEVEVENFAELQEAIDSKVNTIMLDNFSQQDIKKAVSLSKNIVKLEASGNINQHNLVAIAETGIDYISLGTLTKDCTAIDLSMRFLPEACK